METFRFPIKTNQCQSLDIHEKSHLFYIFPEAFDEPSDAALASSLASAARYQADFNDAVGERAPRQKKLLLNITRYKKGESRTFFHCTRASGGASRARTCFMSIRSDRARARTISTGYQKKASVRACACYFAIWIERRKERKRER